MILCMFLPHQTNSGVIDDTIAKVWDDMVNKYYYKKHTLQLLKQRERIVNKSKAIIDGKVVIMVQEYPK